MKDTINSSPRGHARSLVRLFTTALLAGVTSAFAATVNGTLVADVHAKEKFPSANFGTETILQVSAKPNYGKIIYLQFTVSGIPAGSTGISAQLTLRSQTGGPASSVTAHVVSNTPAWTETGVMWTGRPTVGAAIPPAVTNPTGGGNVVWALGGAVSGNGTYSFALDTTYATGDTTFSSREGANPPTLVVTYTPPAAYSVYFGSTHAHTTYTSSHGSVPPDNGPPIEHFNLAKNAANNMDFYVTTDHSQEVAFEPTNANNAAWLDTKADAAQATDSGFVGLAGYEHSENNGGPNPGTGHINVMNTATYLDALETGIDLPYLYNWLENTAQPNGAGLPIVASFNHPGLTQYNSWAYRTAGVTDIITMLEVINSNDTVYEASYRAANNAGWKVSPTSGNDNHGFWGLNWSGTVHNSRVGVLATALTKAGILDAMKNRRTFATRNKNLALHYTANGVIMGSTLSTPGTITFVVTATDPDTGTNNNITLIEIVRPDGTVAASFTPPANTFAVNWTSSAISVGTHKYFYVRARNAEFGAAAMAWAAPIWTGL